MKYVLFLFLLLSQTFWAQEQASIQFSCDTPFYRGVDHWVIFPNSDQENSFFLGFIYIDRQAGFTFHHEGNVIYKNNALTHENPEKQQNKTHISKIRLGANTIDICLLTNKELQQLGLPKTPDWLPIYKKHSDTDDYIIDMASFYNSVQACEIALDMLLPILKSKPNHEKLLFELSYSYNALGQHDQAINILEKALKSHPKKELFYKEMVFALANSERLQEAEKNYALYVTKAETTTYLAETAYNIAYNYYLVKNKPKFEEWAAIVVKQKEVNPQILNSLEYFKSQL